jgi:hypothetical protein
VKERVNKTSDTRTGMRMYRMGQHTLRYEWEGYIRAFADFVLAHLI